MTVTVVIPAYNAAAYIAETIRSVLEQTWTDLEIMVVDDGSVDDTAGVVQAVDDERVRYIYQENATQAVARNTGIAEAGGRLIAFLDADDQWAPDKLARQIPLFEDAKVGCVYCLVARVDKTGGRIPDVSTPACRGDIMEKLLLKNFIACSSAVVRKDLLVQHNLAFRTGRKGAEDWDLWLRFARVVAFDYVPDMLVSYREHEAGTSHDYQLMFQSAMQTLDDFENEITAAGGPETVRDHLQRCVKKSRSLHARYYGHCLLQQGHRREAQELMKQAFAYAPFDIHTWWGVVKASLSG